MLQVRVQPDSLRCHTATTPTPFGPTGQGWPGAGEDSYNGVGKSMGLVPLGPAGRRGVGVGATHMITNCRSTCQGAAIAPLPRPVCAWYGDVRPSLVRLGIDSSCRCQWLPVPRSHSSRSHLIRSQPGAPRVGQQAGGSRFDADRCVPPRERRAPDTSVIGKEIIYVGESMFGFHRNDSSPVKRDLVFNSFPGNRRIVGRRSTTQQLPVPGSPELTYAPSAGSAGQGR